MSVCQCFRFFQNVIFLTFHPKNVWPRTRDGKGSALFKSITLHYYRFLSRFLAVFSKRSMLLINNRQFSSTISLVSMDNEIYNDNEIQVIAHLPTAIKLLDL